MYIPSRNICTLVNGSPVIYHFTDYTVDFDTEEELECSLREMVPSEIERKKLKRQTSKDLSLLSDDPLFPGEDQGNRKLLLSQR